MLSSMLPRTAFTRTVTSLSTKRGLSRSASAVNRLRIATTPSWTASLKLASSRIAPRNSHRFGTCSCRHHEAKTSSSQSTPLEGVTSTETGVSSTEAQAGQTQSDPLDGRMAIAFRCTVEGCGHTQAHMFSKRSYEKGIVIVTCEGCHNRHLIADHLGWFKNLTEEGTHVTIEKLAKMSGEQVKRGSVDLASGVLEYDATEKPSS